MPCLINSALILSRPARQTGLDDISVIPQIVFFSDFTEVGKFVNGTSSDLEIGKTVIINGKINDDGSVAAQSIQLQAETDSPKF